MRKSLASVLMLAAAVTLSAQQTVPAGSDLSKFFSENIPQGCTETKEFSLEAGATYHLTDSTDFSLANVAILGDAANRPTVVVSGNGMLITQNGISIKGVNFDMTNAPLTALVMLNEQPDSMFSTKYLGLKDQGVKDGFILQKPIALESCNLRNVPSSIIYTGFINEGGSGWALTDLSINDCIVQFNKKNSKPAIALDGSWGFSGIQKMAITGSTFYNLADYKCRFLRYGTRIKPGQIFGPEVTTTDHTISHCTFYKTFTGDQFANNMDNSQLNATIDHCIFYDIMRLDQYCYRGGTTCIPSDNVSWGAGKEEALHSNVLKMSEELDPDFAGPTFLPFDLAKPYGGVNFRPENATCVEKQIGDTRWFSAPDIAQFDIPADSEISAFVAEKTPAGSTEMVIFNLAAGANYQLADTADFRLANALIMGNADNRPVVTVNGNGMFRTQNGLQITGVDFDMTEAPLAALVMLNEQPDSMFSTKYLGLKEQGVKDGFILQNPIALKSCNLRNVPSSIIYTGVLNEGNSGWALTDLSIDNCAVQFDKKNSKAAIALDGSWGFSGILNMAITNSTFYNVGKEDNNSYFLRYGTRIKPGQIFGSDVKNTNHTISYCTFYKTFTGKNFANNMDNSQLIATIDHTIFYDINRVDQYCFRNGTSHQGSDNVSWGAGTEEKLHSNVLKMSAELNPDFVGPTDLPYDLADAFGGVNFRPLNPVCTQLNAGDPRWYKASAEPRTLVIPADSEISTFVAENTPAGVTREVTFRLEAGANYQLADSADFKMASPVLLGDVANRPIVTITGNGALITSNGIKVSNINFDMTEAATNSFLKLSSNPDSCFSTKGLGLLEGDNATIVMNGFVMMNPVTIDSCNFRNIPNSILSNNYKAWAVKELNINQSILQFNKQGSDAVIDFTTPDNGNENVWAHFGQVKDLNLTNSTFYNLTEAKARFIRYMNRSNSVPAKAFGIATTSTHTFNACTFYKTFSHKEFANNTPKTTYRTVVIDNTILYDISRLDKFFEGCTVDLEKKNNMAWGAGVDDDGNEQPMRDGVKQIAYIEDPDFAGLCDREFDLSETFGGVCFRPQNKTAIDNKIGDPRWFDSTTGIDAVEAVSPVAEGPAEYFNLQGIRVSADKLVPGIYVVRQGGSTRKIYVK